VQQLVVCFMGQYKPIAQISLGMQLAYARALHLISHRLMWANLSSSTKQFIYNVGQLKAIGSPLHAGPTRNPCQLFIQLANVGFYKCIGKIAHGLSRIHGPYIAELCENRRRGTLQALQHEVAGM